MPATAETWGIYGLTEMLLVTAVRGEERAEHEERDGDLVGAPIAGARVRIAADGEVRIAGPGSRGRVPRGAPRRGAGLRVTWVGSTTGGSSCSGAARRC